LDFSGKNAAVPCGVFVFPAAITEKAAPREAESGAPSVSGLQAVRCPFKYVNAISMNTNKRCLLFLFTAR